MATYKVILHFVYEKPTSDLEAMVTHASSDVDEIVPEDYELEPGKGFSLIFIADAESNFKILEWAKSQEQTILRRLQAHGVERCQDGIKIEDVSISFKYYRKGTNVAGSS